MILYFLSLTSRFCLSILQYQKKNTLPTFVLPLPAAMFSRSQNKSFSKSQKIGKSGSFSKDAGVSKPRRHDPARLSRRPPTIGSAAAAFVEDGGLPPPSQPTTRASAIVTLVVGREQRIFAAHEDILCASPFFQQALHNQPLYYDPRSPFSSPTLSSPGSPGAAATKRIALPDDEPEIFSCVLEYLYKGDYYPRLLHNKRRNSWDLERSETSSPDQLPDSSVLRHPVEGDLLKDTVVYCTAERFGLEDLKRIALRKQGLRMCAWSSRPFPFPRPSCP